MRIVFMGTPEFAVPSLDALCAAGMAPALVVTQPPARRGRRSHEEPTPAAAAARARNLDVLETDNVCDGDAFARVAALKPDLVVVVAFGQILRKNLLDLPAHGCLNLHPSLLPKYRGAAPVAWAIMDGVTASGISIIKLVKKLDAGPIVAQEPFAIGPDETAADANARAAIAGAAILARVVGDYAAGRPPAERVQDDALATYAGMFTKEHGEVDFNKPARAVWNQIRAVQPWPRASAWHRPADGGAPSRLILWRALVDDAATVGSRVPEEPARAAASAGVSKGAERSDEAAGSPAPGTILSVFPDGIRVACAPGVLTLTELQAEGRSRQPAAEFLKGHPVALRDTFTARLNS
jgi:methionyl-tRNA formyltransferase